MIGIPTARKSIRMQPPIHRKNAPKLPKIAPFVKRAIGAVMTVAAAAGVAIGAKGVRNDSNAIKNPTMDELKTPASAIKTSILYV